MGREKQEQMTVSKNSSPGWKNKLCPLGGLALGNGAKSECIGETEAKKSGFGRIERKGKPF